MIDFRYHIVSIIAIFLALGAGVLLGSTVLSTGTVTVLERQTSALERGLAGAKSDITALRGERDQARALAGQVSEWVVQGRLQGQRFVAVFDGGSGRWRDGIRQALTDAGAQSVGSLTLTSKWSGVEGAADELALLVREALGLLEPGPRPAEAALTALGRRLHEPGGQLLLRKLVEAKFLSVDGADLKATWPPRGSPIVALASSYPKTAPQPSWLGAFAAGAASAGPALVVSANHTNFSATTVLRTADATPSLSTFDAGDTAMAKVGSTLAFEAAVKGHGGHFGAEPGRRLVPEPA